MKRLNQAGVTIVELMMSVAIAAALTTALFAVSLNFFGDTLRSQMTSEMAVNSHFMLRAVVEDLRIGSNIGTNSVLTDANAPTGGWTTSDTNNVLIINLPAVTTDNNIIYNSDTGDPYLNEYIYFLDGMTLNKRLLKNPDAVGNSIKTTCPPSQSSSTCPSDRKYSTYVSSFTFEFYDENDAVTADPALARSVKVDLTTSRTVFGTPVRFSNSILTKLRN